MSWISLHYTWFSINHVLVSNLIIRIFWGAFISSSLNQHRIICLDRTNTCYWRYRVTLDIALVSHELISDSFDLTLIRASSSAGETQGFLCRNRGLLLRDAVLLVALEGLLQRAEGQTAAHQVHHHHHKHGHHRLPLHDRVQSRPVCGSVHPRHPRWPSGTRWRGAGERSDRSLSPHSPIGFCMAATLAWTRLDWTFFGGMMFVWTATKNRHRPIHSLDLLQPKWTIF